MKGSALIPAGQELALTSDQRVCASMSHIGDTFTTHLTQDIVGPVGVVIPKGTVATAQVSSVKKGVGINIESLIIDGQTYQISSDVTHADIEKSRTRSGLSTRTVGAGAGLGGVVGGVIGRDVKSTVIGAAGGAIAGAVAARPTYRSDACIPNGGQIVAQLTTPLRLSISSE